MLAHAPLVPGAKQHYVEAIGRQMLVDGDGYGWTNLTMEWERTWAVGCTLYVNFERNLEERSERVSKGVSKKYVCEVYSVKVDVSWSGTSRSPAAARASVALYSQVADLATLIQAQLEPLSIGRVRGEVGAPKSAEVA